MQFLALGVFVACSGDATDTGVGKDDSNVDSVGDTDTGAVTDTDTGEDSDTNTETAVDTDCMDDDYSKDMLRHAEALDALIDGTADECVTAWYIRSLEERSQCEGPWFEDTFVSWSPDGYTFDISDATPIFTSTAVLDAMIGPDGRYYLVFGEGNLDVGIQAAEEHSDWFSKHGLAGFGAINGAVSDDGITFTRLDEFEVEGIVRGMVVDPDVIALPDGTFRMYYVGTPVAVLVEPGSWDDGVQHEAFYAESDDLIHWRQIGMAVSGPNADPSVWCGDDGYCVMASTGIDFSTSTDAGETWTFDWTQDPFGFAPEFHELEDGRVRLFYNSKVQGGALESEISEDGGRTFKYEGEVLPGYTVEAISLAPAPAERGGYYLYYHYWQEPYSGDYWGEHPCIPEDE